MKQITLFLLPMFLLLFFTVNAQDFQADPNGPYQSSSPDLVEVEVHYDGDNTSGVGAADANFIIAARFTQTQLGAYVNKGITKLRIFIRDATVGNTGTIKFYAAGTSTTPGAEIYSEAVTTVPLSWNEYNLTPFIAVPNTDLWVGFQATAGPTGAQFWGGTDAGLNHPDGQFIYFNGAWATLIALNPALTFNWNIRAVVDTEIPVELTSFTAQSNGTNVLLNWSTATEVNNHGFEVQRSNGEDFVTVAFIQGKGTTTEAIDYSYVDNNLSSGTYSYRLKQIDFNGVFEYSDMVEVDVSGLSEYTLLQNYPNPFNPSTKISFNLIVDSKVTLKIFDLLGQEVVTLINQEMSAGLQEINFDASGLNSGVYFYKVEANGVDGQSFTSVKKMLLTK